MSCGSRHAVPGLVLACLRCRREAMSFSSSVFPPAPCHHMIAGRSLVRRPRFAHRRLLLAPGGIALVSCRPFDLRRRDERRGGACLLDYRGVARRLMYIMNMMYAMYIKDTKIQEYKNTMNILGDEDETDDDVMSDAGR